MSHAWSGRRSTLRFPRAALVALSMLPPLAASAAPIDLNEASRAELETLPMIGPARAEAIVAHREAEGSFRAVDEVTGVRSIGQGILDRIRPHVTVGASDTEAEEASAATREDAAPEPDDGSAADADEPLDLGSRRPALDTSRQQAALAERRGESDSSAADEAGASPVNLNTADPEALQALRGVGPALAERIIEHRTHRGPFASVEAAREVSGIGPATLASIRDDVTVAVDLNRAETRAFEAIGIRPDAARAIVEHRETHGSFASVEAVAEVPGVDEDVLATLRPILTASP